MIYETSQYKRSEYLLKKVLLLGGYLILALDTIELEIIDNQFEQNHFSALKIGTFLRM